MASSLSKTQRNWLNPDQLHGDKPNLVLSGTLVRFLAFCSGEQRLFTRRSWPSITGLYVAMFKQLISPEIASRGQTQTKHSPGHPRRRDDSRSRMVAQQQHTVHSGPGRCKHQEPKKERVSQTDPRLKGEGWTKHPHFAGRKSFTEKGKWNHAANAAN